MLWALLRRAGADVSFCVRAATTGNIRGVTNNAGTTGSGGQRPGEVSADVMPSTTNQGGGVRPSQVTHPSIPRNWP